MKLYEDQLVADLKKAIRPVYLVSGDDPLLMQEASDAIRSRLRQAGYAERDLFHVDKSFDWHQVLFSANSMSLFAEKKLIELRLSGSKPGNEGGAVLQAYTDKPQDDRVLLIITDKLDAATQRTKWYKSLSDAGVHVQVRQVELNKLPSWLNRRVQSAGMTADRDAIAALVDKVEGNLLAAVQEIERIRLIAGPGNIDISKVLDEVADNSRYSVFGLIDAALAGDARRSIRMVTGLQDEGVPILQIAGLLGRELRLLSKMSAAIGRASGVDSVMRSHGVWSNRIVPVKQALGRHRQPQFDSMLTGLARLDKLVKGLEGEDPWDLLREIVAHLAGIQVVTRSPAT